MDALHLITVHETSAAELAASGAKLGVRIAGQSFFTGREAFTKAGEVADLVAALKELSLTEDNVHLRNVSAEVQSGFLTKTSSAAYSLVIHCQSIELLGRILSAVSSLKNAQLTGISWQYPDLEKAKRELIQTAVGAAKESAIVVAESLGVPLLGVHKLSYGVSGLANDDALFSPEPSAYAGRERKAKAALDSLELAHLASVKVSVTGEFIVGLLGDNA